MLISVLNTHEIDLLQHLRRYAYKGVDITDECILNRIRATAAANLARRNFAVTGALKAAKFKEMERLKQDTQKSKIKKH